MAILHTISNAYYTVSIGDHGIPALIQSVSDSVQNIYASYIMKNIWLYYDDVSQITYPGAGTLTNSGLDFSEVTITDSDSYGNTCTIVQTTTLTDDLVDIKTQITLTYKDPTKALYGISPVNHYQVILYGYGMESGEYITTVGSNSTTQALGVYPNDINSDYFRDGENEVWIAIRQVERHLILLGAGYSTLRGEGLTASGGDPDRVRIALEGRVVAFNEVGDSRFAYHRFYLNDSNISETNVRILASEMHTQFTNVIPNPGGTPPEVSGTNTGSSRSRSNVYAVGTYDTYLDSITIRDNFMAQGDDIFLWMPQRVYYTNPQNTSDFVRVLGYDPAVLCLNLLRPKAGVITLRIWPVSPYFVRNPTKSVYRADQKVLNGYYGQPDGYPPLHLMAQPEHADMTQYWEDALDLSTYYDFDILSLEEMYYVDISYGPDDETHFIAWVLANTGEILTGFPRVAKPAWYWADAADDGNIVKFWDSNVIAWRNYCAEIFYTKWRDILHLKQKKLSVEVRWSCIPGVTREEVEGTIEAGTLDVGWKSVPYWNAYDYALISKGIADILVIWWYWDIWTTDLGAGVYETTNTPSDFTDQFIDFLNREAHVGSSYHLHIAPRYKGENVTPVPDWWKYSLDKFESSLILYKKNLARQISCDLGPMPGTHSITVTLTDVSQTNEAVIRGSGSFDSLRYWKDVVVSLVGDTVDTADYTEGTDYEFEGNQLHWLGVSSPIDGNTYYVTYTAHEYSESYAEFSLVDADMKSYYNAWFRFSGTTEIP